MVTKPLVLILCGGQSLRLWPLSEYKSKNFLDIFGFSPLEVTIRRFLKITPKENIFLVANQKEKAQFRNLALLNQRNIFFEPESKNTAPAVLFSLLTLARKFSPEKVLIITPIDHFIKNETRFYAALKKGVAAAGNHIVTVGIKPKEASSHFGYVQINKKKTAAVYPVKRFLEKPSRIKAKQLIKKGNVYYNSGMFIASLGVLWKEYRKYYPYGDDFRKAIKRKTLSLLYRKITNISFDKAIMEKSKCVRLVKSDFYWRDFGSWHTIYEMLAKDKRANVCQGDVCLVESKNNLVYLQEAKKKTLIIGVRDLFVVDTRDYILIAHRSMLDTLKSNLKALKGS